MRQFPARRHERFVRSRPENAFKGGKRTVQKKRTLIRAIIGLRMEQTCNRKYSTAFACVREENRNSGLDNDYRLRKQVDDLCLALFDRWCERREITPLIYLLHAWPLFRSNPHPVKRLAAALRDLSMFHMETLDDMDRELIGNVHAITGYDR